MPKLLDAPRSRLDPCLPEATNGASAQLDTNGAPAQPAPGIPREERRGEDQTGPKEFNSKEEVVRAFVPLFSHPAVTTSSLAGGALPISAKSSPSKVSDQIRSEPWMDPLHRNQLRIFVEIVERTILSSRVM
ncbi:hypothetical protein R1sor_025290 [Riccia sorocarpa]|uniref:Uncharacterized protein n=1 Tax=Riccia sorocarpa TaxID=122646 RepID=A0ABD3G9Q9_9MARC